MEVNKTILEIDREAILDQSGKPFCSRNVDFLACSTILLSSREEPDLKKQQFDIIVSSLEFKTNFVAGLDFRVPITIFFATIHRHNL